MVANKIEGTGTPDGDLEKVKEFLKVKNEEFLGKGIAEDGTYIEGVVVGCPDYRVNRRNIFIRGSSGCRVVTENGFAIDNIPEVFNSKHIYTVKASFEPRLIERFKKVDDDYADIEPIQPKEKFEDVEIVEKTFTSKPEEKTNSVEQKNNSSNISAPNTGVQASSDVGYYAFVSLPLLMSIAWFSFKKQ